MLSDFVGFFLVALLVITIIHFFSPKFRVLPLKKKMASVLLLWIVLVVVTQIVEMTKNKKNITDYGKPCIHSLMCDNKCWVNKSDTVVSATNKSYGPFIIGGCGYERVYGCASEVRWGLTLGGFLCIDPTF